MIWTRAAALTDEAPRKPKILAALQGALPQEIQQLADRGYQMLLQDPRHPSLHFKRIGRVWSARVGLHH